MRQPTPSAEGGLEAARRAYQQAAAQVEQQQEALRRLRALLIELAEQDLRLHGRTLSLLQEMNRDIERFKRQMKRLNTART